MDLAHLLASAPNIEDTPPAWIPPAILLGGGILLWMLIRWLRDRLRKPESGTPGGFTLRSLRALVQEGKMSQEEYELAKDKILAANKRAIAIKPAQETTSPKQFPPRA